MKWKYLLMCLVSFSSLQAQSFLRMQNTSDKVNDPHCMQPEDHILTGYFGGQANYSLLDTADNIEFQNLIYGANFGVNYRASHVLFSGDFIWNQGHFTKNNEEHHIQDAFGTVTVGYFFFSKDIMVGPFVGLGLRRWNDKSNESTDKSIATLSVNHLHYLNYFIPFGLIFNWYVSCGFRFGLIATMMPSFDSTLEVEGLNDTKWMLGRKTSFSIELPFVWRMVQSNMWKNVEIVLAPYWRLLKTGGSVTLGLPERDQTYIGIGLRIQKRTR